MGRDGTATAAPGRLGVGRPYSGPGTARRWGAIISGVTLSTPDSTGRVAPVIHRASSLARNAAAQPTSQPSPGVPSRPACSRIVFMNSARGPGADTDATIGVVMCPGAIALTRMPWRPCEYAMSMVIAIIPPLAAEYATVPSPRSAEIDATLTIEPPPLAAIAGT